MSFPLQKTYECVDKCFLSWLCMYWLTGVISLSVHPTYAIFMCFWLDQLSYADFYSLMLPLATVSYMEVCLEPFLQSKHFISVPHILLHNVMIRFWLLSLYLIVLLLLHDVYRFAHWIIRKVFFQCSGWLPQGIRYINEIHFWAETF